MKTDFHVHTSFSKDSDASPESMIQEAIRKGLEVVCITDHLDLDFAEPGFEINFDNYFPVLQALKEKYSEKIDVRMGVEFGMQPHLVQECTKLVNRYPFDFVIGSLHIIDGQDPYYRKSFEGRTDEELYRRAFELTLEDVRAMDDFDVLGHLDYIVRYGKMREAEYSYQQYSDYIDAILKCLVEKGKGVEINTAGWKYGLPFAHPHPDVLKRYRELGGEIITIGSDGHKPEHIAYNFDKVSDILRMCGFKYYTEFKQRKPIFRQLP